MKDYLQEVAGTKVYDDRRLQSVNILQETQKKKEMIEETLKRMDERLDQLKVETAALEEYQEWDRKKRAVEYTIYDKELRGSRAAMERLEKQRQEEAAKRDASHDSSAKDLETLKELTNKSTKLEAELSRIDQTKQALEEDRREAMKVSASLELDVQELKSRFSNEDTLIVELKTELEDVQKKILGSQKEIKKIEPTLEKAKSDQQDYRNQYDLLKSKHEALLDKQSRTKQFSSQKDRDTWINAELKSIHGALAQKKNLQTSLKEEINSEEGKIQELEEELKDRKGDLDRKKKKIEEINQVHRTALQKRDEYTNQRKDLWSEDSKMEVIMNEAQAELAKADRNLHASIGKSKCKGLEAVRILQAQHNIDGVHGPLIELISCDNVYKKAVEVTANDQLFSIVVDNDNIASRLIKHMNEKKMDGRVTFLPLNRLNGQPKKFNGEKDNDVVPMIGKIQYDSKINNAVVHVFGT